MIYINRIYFLLLLVLSTLDAQDYKLGRGYEVYGDDKLSLTVGAHIDINVNAKSDGNESAKIGQSGVLLFGNYTSKFRFLAELGSDEAYRYTMDEATSDSTDFKLSRLYGEYLFSDSFELKAGRFLTPIGIWNKTYIPALRWSNFTPFVAKGFFPKIIDGASMNGTLLPTRDISYSLFYHIEGESDNNDNNINAKEFAGGEIRYHFSPMAKIAIPFGRYRSDSSTEIVHFTGLNFILPFNKNELSLESLYKDGEWTDANAYTNKWKDYAWYLQYVQHVYKASYLCIRYEEERRVNSSIGVSWNDKATVLGYIYRPVTSFSTKLEFRHREKSGENSFKNDEALVSFSVLF